MITTIFMIGRSQAVRLPREFRLPGRLANIRRWGDGILLEPIKPSKWPKGYFEKVKIKDSAFERQRVHDKKVGLQAAAAQKSSNRPEI